MTGERILVIDDEQSIRSLLGRLCQREGYAVLLASTGEEAFQMLAASAVDVAIVDLNLPDIYGIEILRHIKDTQPETEVIILTGHGDLSSAIEAMRLGAYDYLLKPVPSLQIISLTIMRAVERQRLGRHNEELIVDLQRANQALEVARHNQISHLRDLGQILAGSLSLADVSDVLIRAVLGLTECDASGVLLLPQSKEDVPLATIGSRFALAEPAREQILQHMISSLGSPALAQAAESIDERSWSQHELTDLETEWQSWGAEPFVAREDTLGVLVMARHTAEPLSEEESNMLGVLVSQATTALDNVHLFQRMRDLATRDRLTGLYNHGHFFELLEAEISRAERHATELAVIMLDIDRKSGLKSVNDTYGHQAGDRLLREFGLSLKASLRRADVVARYGGDEFVVLAPQTTRRSAIALAERICERVRNTAFAVSDGHTAQITVSGGVTVFYPGTGLAAADIVGLADRATYQAKDLGGDQICIVDAPYSA